MPNGLFYLHSSDRSISNIRGIWLVFIISSSVFNASVDPDQTQHFAASDLGLHCLLMSLLWDGYVLKEESILLIANYINHLLIKGKK